LFKYTLFEHGAAWRTVMAVLDLKALEEDRAAALLLVGLFACRIYGAAWRTVMAVLDLKALEEDHAAALLLVGLFACRI
jgi:hypothetical protein